MWNSGRKRKDARRMARAAMTRARAIGEPREKYLLYRRDGHKTVFIRLEVIDTRRIYHDEEDRDSATHFTRKRAMQLADRCTREAAGCGSAVTFGVVTYSQAR